MQLIICLPTLLIDLLSACSILLFVCPPSVSPSIHSSSCLFICLPFHLFVFLPICLFPSICLSHCPVHVTVCTSIYMTALPSVCLSFPCLSFLPPVCLSFHLSIFPSTCLFILRSVVCPSICLSFLPSFCLSIQFYVFYLYFSLFLSIFLSTFLSIFLSFCPLVSLSYHLPVFPSICLSIYLSVHLLIRNPFVQH